MKCFFVAQISIHDPDEYQKYLDGFDEVFSRHKGVVMAVDEDPTVLEGAWSCTRTVLIGFPNEDEARRWYDSPGYQELVKHRRRASTANIVLVKRRAKAP